MGSILALKEIGVKPGIPVLIADHAPALSGSKGVTEGAELSSAAEFRVCGDAPEEESSHAQRVCRR